MRSRLPASPSSASRSRSSCTFACAGCAPRSSRCRGAAAATSSISPSRSRDGLHRTIDELAAALGRLERRVDATVSRLAVVRYDAYENTGGHQSASVALLDSSRTGVVLSAIQGRDYARIYVKELDGGRAAVSLSPEEQEAVERAMRSQQ